MKMSIDAIKNKKVCLRFLYLTRCILVGSEAGDGPALLTATMRNWYSPFSLRSTTLASSWSPATSAAFSQSGLNLVPTRHQSIELDFRVMTIIRLVPVFLFDDVFLDFGSSVRFGRRPFQIDALLVVVDYFWCARSSSFL